MLATTMKAKLAIILTSAAVASGGTLATVMAVRHHQTVAQQTIASVPLPLAPPSETPAPVASPNALKAADTPVSATAAPVQSRLKVQNVQYTPGYSPAPQRSYTPYAPRTYEPQPAPSYQPYTVQPYQPAYSSYSSAPAAALLNDQQLDQLLAPVALYPDPLIAEMLPASTYPDDLATAAAVVRGDPNMAEYVIDQQAWDESVKALAHSPSVLTWMADNGDWTRTLGAAVTYQQGDVMNSIQRLRAQAYAAGSLVETPQQTVVVQDRNICIEPATAEVVYVPVYDWRTVYVSRPQTPITFFAGLRVGSWLDNDCDWNDRFITVGARWDRGWDHRWDHDRNARQTAVIVRNDRDHRDDRRDTDNRTTVNRTTVNNTTVNNNTVVKVGGTQWKRNDAKAAPTLPPSVKPAGKSAPTVQTKVRNDTVHTDSERPAPAPQPKTPPQRQVVTPPKTSDTVVTPKVAVPPTPKIEPTPEPKVIVPKPEPRATPKPESKVEPKADEPKPTPQVIVPREIAPKTVIPDGRGDGRGPQANRGNAGNNRGNGRGNPPDDGDHGRGRGN